MKQKYSFYIAVLVALVAATAHAQIAGVPGPWYRPPGMVYGRYWPYGGYYGGQFSSTVAEGQARGMAAVIQAQGQAAKAQAQARLELEEARAKYIDNQKKWQENYQERKRMREAERAQKLAESRAARERKQQSKPPQPMPEPGLGVSQLNPVTGELSWPEALMDAAFADNRAKLEELFKLRAQTSSTIETSNQIDSAVRDMNTQLKKRIRDMDPQPYIAARRFLDKLAYEARLPVG